MVCSTEAQSDLAAALGVRPSQPPASTWEDRLFTCRYVYPDGVLVLAVKDLPDEAATTAYFTSMRDRSAPAVVIPALGQAAFAAPDGSTFLRKDFAVLHVDVGGLPERFGQPPRARAGIAVIAATVIMTCWTEH
jgi:hypothetical protein